MEQSCQLKATQLGEEHKLAAGGVANSGVGLAWLVAPPASYLLELSLGRG